MAQERKLLRNRIQIGIHDDGKPNYKWVQGWTLEELFDSVVRTYVEYGMIWKFMEKTDTAEKQIEAVSFEAYAMHWFTVYKAGLKPTSKKDYLYILNHYLTSGVWRNVDA